MANTKEFLTEHLRKTASRPFLFVGSGFSIRYIGLDSWPDLLKRFADKVGDFDYYLTAADNQLPRAASLIAKDYFPYWWQSAECKSERDANPGKLPRASSALKISISKYIDTISNYDLSQSLYKKEIEAISGLNVDGIITTNWDLLLESLFPNYKVFIGQQSIVTQVPQNIGEIYKIHGCSSEPNSLVLTEEDYNEFIAKQAYLAAKLITIFVEHPIVFLGYSVSDPNIISLLQSIVVGLGQKEKEKLRDNLIFVQRSKQNRPAGVQSTLLVVDKTQLPVTQIVTDSFEEVYTVIGEQKRKLPATVLRFCKEQLYNIAHESEPEKKLCLVDIDEVDNYDNIEFVVGLGVASRKVGDFGYKTVGATQLIKCLLAGDENLSAENVLDDVLSSKTSRKRYLPTYYFLQKVGIKSEAEFNTSKYKLKINLRKFEDCKTKGYGNSYVNNCKDLTTSQIISKFPPDKCALLLPFQQRSEIDKNALRDFLIANESRYIDGNYSSFYRKLACLYDIIAYGWG